jgi:hypothetical protein
MMAYYKIRVLRCKNSPSEHIVSALKSQDAIRISVMALRDWGITDARAIEIVGQVKSLRG